MQRSFNSNVSTQLPRQAQRQNQRMRQVQTLRSVNAFSNSFMFPKIESFKVPLFKNKPLKISGGRNTFSVFGRRYGKFNPIGKASNLNEAFNIGKRFGNNTLGATFKIQGGKGLSFKTPTGYYAKNNKKNGQLFIQKNKFRLSSLGEKSEIKRSKKRFKF